MPSECSAPVIHSERIKIITVLPPNIIIARNAIKLLRPIMDQIVSARMNTKYSGRVDNKRRARASQPVPVDNNCRQKSHLGSNQPVVNVVAADAVPKFLMNLTA